MCAKPTYHERGVMQSYWDTVELRLKSHVTNTTHDWDSNGRRQRMTDSDQRIWRMIDSVTWTWLPFRTPLLKQAHNNWTNNLKRILTSPLPGSLTITSWSVLHRINHTPRQWDTKANESLQRAQMCPWLWPRLREFAVDWSNEWWWNVVVLFMKIVEWVLDFRTIFENFTLGFCMHRKNYGGVYARTVNHETCHTKPGKRCGSTGRF
jgi:hypothetical protein